MNFATPSPADFYRVMPELVWCGFGVLLMLLQSLTKNRPALTTVAFIGATAGTATSIPTSDAVPRSATVVTRSHPARAVVLLPRSRAPPLSA